MVDGCRVGLPTNNLPTNYNINLLSNYPILQPLCYNFKWQITNEYFLMDIAII